MGKSKKQKLTRERKVDRELFGREELIDAIDLGRDNFHIVFNRPKNRPKNQPRTWNAESLQNRKHDPSERLLPIPIPDGPVNRTDINDELKRDREFAKRLLEENAENVVERVRALMESGGRRLKRPGYLSYFPIKQLKKLRRDALLRSQIDGDIYNTALLLAINNNRLHWLTGERSVNKDASWKGESSQAPSRNREWQQLSSPFFSEVGRRRPVRSVPYRELNRSEVMHYRLPLTVDDGPMGDNSHQGWGCRLWEGRSATVDNMAEFRLQFDAFTMGVLKGVSLQGAVVGGSAVVSSMAPLPFHMKPLMEKYISMIESVRLMPLPSLCQDNIIRFLPSPIPELANKLAQERAEGPHPYRDSDIDIFLIANSKEEGLCKIQHLVEEIRANIPGPSALIRTHNAITICSQRPYRNVQIVLSMYRSVHELLDFVDLDCTAVCFDGNNVYMHERAKRAFATKFNFVAPALLQHAMVQGRVQKYRKRGFGAVMFELCKHHPRCDVVYDNNYANNVNSLNGGRRRSVRPFNNFSYDSTYVPYLSNHSELLLELERAEATWKAKNQECPWLVSSTLQPLLEGLLLEKTGSPAPGTSLFEQSPKEKQPLSYQLVDLSLYDLECSTYREKLTVSETSLWRRWQHRHSFLLPLRWRVESILSGREPLLFVPSCYQCGNRFTKGADDRNDLIPICPACAEVNKSKRLETADLRGKVAIVTGARIKIGYQCALKLLRCGAIVVATTRFPKTAEENFKMEDDSAEWFGRLHVVGLDMRAYGALLSFIEDTFQKFGYVDIVINNAAQTVRRPPQYYRSLVEQERRMLAEECSRRGKIEIIDCNDNDEEMREVGEVGGHSGKGETTAMEMGKSQTNSQSHAVERFFKQEPGSTSWALTQLPLVEKEDVMDETTANKVFPVDHVDPHGEQLDLRSITTWNKEAHEVSATEMVEVQLVNSIAPSLLLSRLLPGVGQGWSASGRPSASADTDKDRVARFCINVSSREGQFSAPKKSHHVHTNMAKAALNMLTLTLGPSLALEGVFVYSVDTGWVSNMGPEKQQLPGAAKLFSQPPLTDADGAARVLDPVISGYNQLHKGGTLPIAGVLLRNFRVASW